MNATQILHLERIADKAYHPLTGSELLKDSYGQIRGFTAVNDHTITISIAGTKSLQDVRTDGDILQEHTEHGLVHRGFWREYKTLQMAIASLMLRNPGKTVRAAGHSLGGALAVYASADAGVLGRSVDLVTLGCPNPGDARFNRFVRGLGVRHTRIVHRFDVVPLVPFLGYSNFGDRIHIDSDGNRIWRPHSFVRSIVRLDETVKAWIHGEQFKDHFIKNYLSASKLYFSFSKGGAQ